MDDSYDANFRVPGARTATGRPQEHYENREDADRFAQALADSVGEAVVLDRGGNVVAKFTRR